MRKNKDVVTKWVVKTNMGMLCDTGWAYDIRWTNSMNDIHDISLYDSYDAAQLRITAYKSTWPNVTWAKVAELNIAYLGTTEEITERELLEESVYNTRND